MAHPPNIPLVPQTNEQNFPRHDPKATWGHSGHGWPRMLCREFLPEDVDLWLNSHVQSDKSYHIRCPRPRRVLTTGKVVPGERVPIKVVQELVDAGYADTIGDDLLCQDAKTYPKLVAYLASIGIEVADVVNVAEAEPPSSL